ncbi:hypothetical protein [Pseudarthrobacter sp. YAF2]|uniref:hypothetical protein n=1 Tax=Pseudarthrobacter sp. YAF2 TaxID=3233078 RepID=UPI003F969C70
MSESNAKSATGRNRKPPRLRRRYVGLILLVLLLGALVILAAALAGKVDLGKATPEILLPLFLIIGLTVLMVVLMLVALTTNFIAGRKNGKPEALGMPAGSVSAVIALMLLLVFASFTIFFFTQIRFGEGDGYISRGVTAQALQALPQNRILQLNVQNPEADPAARTYEVRLAAEHPASVDFAQSASTLIGTLLSAIAGFYFGGKATKMGVDATRTAAADGLAKTKETAGNGQHDVPAEGDHHERIVDPG